MKVYLTCSYCNHAWVIYYYTSHNLENLKCEVCGDKNIKAKKVKQIDYYSEEIVKDPYVNKDDDNE